MALTLVIAALLVSGFSGVPSLWGNKASTRGQSFTVGAMVLSMTLGLAGAVLALAEPSAETRWFLGPATHLSLVGLDALSAFFLVPIFLVGGLGSVFGLGYWSQANHHENGRRVGFFWGLLVAGMTLLVISTNAFGFLLGWEGMALSAFFLIASEDKTVETRRASLVYLLATHVGTLALFGFFTVWQGATGSYDLLPIAADTDFTTLSLLFFLALLAFGLKAGLAPLHFWLPGAHANAPTHVSAILSGVVLKMGVYGLVRVVFLLPDPPAAWGFVVLALGLGSAFLGVVFALAQHDLKRLLAYHSVENIGIIFLGLGMAMVGKSFHNLTLQVLGLAGCLLHVWNHSLFKSLLFFGAGSVIHGTGTRQIDQLGGLAKTLPVTAALFLVGSAAIVGLPPLNGFISEFFVYLGLFGTLGQQNGQTMALALSAPVLAVVGALALACFVKVYTTVFLGTARMARVPSPPESPWSMVLAPAVLAVGCAVIGVFPGWFAPVLDGVMATLRSPGAADFPPVAAVAPLTTLSVLTGVLFAAVALVALPTLWIRRQKRAPTWDCGYARPTSRMQYTATSFAQSLVDMFAWVLKPKSSPDGAASPFPQRARWKSHVDELILDRVLTPWAQAVEKLALWFRHFQQGLTQNYVAYILITLLVLLGFLVPYREIFALLTAR